MSQSPHASAGDALPICTLAEHRDALARLQSEFGVALRIFAEEIGEALAMATADTLRKVRDVRTPATETMAQTIAVIVGSDAIGLCGLSAARKLSAGGSVVRVLRASTTLPTAEHAALFACVRANGAEIVSPTGATSAKETADGAPADGASADGVGDGWLHDGVALLIWAVSATDLVGAEAQVAQRLLDGLVKRRDLTVIAVDGPPHVDLDTGRVHGAARAMQATVIAGLPKLGNLLYPGAALCGAQYRRRGALPVRLECEIQATAVVASPPELPARRADGHKGAFGDVLLVAGAAGYYGAPALAALAALRTGAGYARLATPRSLMPVVASLCPEAVLIPLDETSAGSLALSNESRLIDLSERADFVVLGPGLSLDDETQTLVRRLAHAVRKPLLIDGDGLTAVAADRGVIAARQAPTILTPHPGEMARLCKTTVAELGADPVAQLRAAARALRATIVQKGAHSQIGLSDGRVLINLSGNSGMGTAGSGDVLSGTIAAMFGLGLAAPEAAHAGVFLHGVAGDLAARELGEDGLIARSLVEVLPRAMKRYREDLRGLFAAYRAKIAEI